MANERRVLPDVGDPRALASPLVPDTELVRRGVREVVAVEVGRPLEPELVHQLLTAVLGGQAQRPAENKRLFFSQLSFENEVDESLGRMKTIGDVTLSASFVDRGD